MLPPLPSFAEHPDVVFYTKAKKKSRRKKKKTHKFLNILFRKKEMFDLERETERRRERVNEITGQDQT